MRLFPILIIIVLIFMGAIYWSTTFDHVESTTVIDANNSSMGTGYTLTMDIAGFASQQWVILAFLAFLILIGGVFAVLIRGGSD